MPSVGAVTSNLNVVTKTANYTAAANDLVLANAASGAITITMPTAPVVNTVVAVKKADNTTSAVSIVPGGTANINGDISALLAVAGAAATFQYDGTNWQLISTGTINTASAAGLPMGGTVGQVLAKSSATNYDSSWITPSGTSKVTASNVALGSQAASQSAFTYYTVPSICARGIASQFTVTVDTAGTFDLEVRGAGSTGGTLWLQATGITTVTYNNSTVWYLENDAAAQSMFIGVKNLSTGTRTFTLTTLRVEKFA